MRYWSLALLGIFVGCDLLKTQEACPLIVYIPSHRISVFTEIAPENVSIEVDGEEQLDECSGNSTGETPPVVQLTRHDNRLEILVQHFGAYETLPENVSLTIRDKATCSGGDAVFFEVHDLPLDFETTYPHGVKCGSKIFAHVSIEGP